MNKIDIVIPCYNESGNLERVINESSKIVRESNHQINFIFVDNGSTDNSLEVVRRFGKLPIGVRVVSTTPNRGYGGGILFGLGFSTAPYLGWTHADLQTPLKDCLTAIELLERDVDFVKGFRVNREVGDKFFSACMGLLESLIFWTHLREINAQPTMFKRGFFEKWDDPPTDFSLDLYALVMVKRGRGKVERFNVSFMKRGAGNSKWNSGLKSRARFIKRTISYSLRLRRNLG
jgi:glycosyltransferase involved in cell wall biosynthesis